MMDLFGFLLKHRGGRTAGGSGIENGPTGEIFFTDGLVALQGQDEIGRLEGVVSRAKDFVLIALQRADPGVDIGGVLLWIVGNAPLRGKEDAGQFGAKLLLRVVRVAETIGFSEGRTVETRGVTGPVS